jgi:hypothetical protein
MDHCIPDPVLLMSYPSESALVDEFVLALGAKASPWGDMTVAREFDYKAGRTDVVAVSAAGHVVAFEAKLGRWRDALHQAYRNTCFAHRSYVVLPAEAALRAVRYEREFRRRKVGLCFMENGRLEVVLEPPSVEPILPWLCERVNHFARTSAAEPLEGSS